MTQRKHTSCNSIQDVFVDALFGDIQAEALNRLNSHLSTCKACEKAFKEMQGTLRITKHVVPEEPPESFWAEFQDRLDQRIARETTKKQPGMGARLTARMRSLLLPPPAWVYQTGIAVVLVVIGNLHWPVW